MCPVPAPESTAHRREHPWERMRRLAFARWETELRRIPYGRPLPDVVGFAYSIEPPAHWSDAEANRRLFALAAQPTGLGATYLASLPARTRRPAEGALVRLPQPTKGVLTGSDGPFGEIVLEARRGFEPATWDEILPGTPPRSASNVVSVLSELWHLPPRAVESLLLPLVGSNPWHGLPAGLDLCVEVAGWSLARHRTFLTGILDMVPDWVHRSGRRSSTGPRLLELASGARIRRGSPATARPFSVELRSVSSAPPAPISSEMAPRSVITYGPPLRSEFTSFLSAGPGLLLLGPEETGSVPQVPEEVPDAVRAAVWALHWWTPEPPDAPDWYRWLREEEPRLRETLDTLPGSPPDRPNEGWGDMVDRRNFRDRLAQTAIGRARLRAAPEVEASDLRWVVDSLIRVTDRATVWARAGQGPLVRALDRTEGGRTTRLRRTLEGLFLDRAAGLSLSEAVAGLRASGAVASEWDIENQLERLRIRGVLFQDRAGRYRVA
ncbi:MAG: hypothetical protein L3K14_03690 [Thermoplasmata archaeon]|nr:hypothetical protein [Thermoplasmata archaeon]